MTARMVAAVLIAAVLGGASGAAMGPRPAAVVPSAPVLVWVYPNGADAPVQVRRGEITDVHACEPDGDCLAMLNRSTDYVWVRRADFPRASQKGDTR